MARRETREVGNAGSVERAVLFADLAGFAALTEAHGDGGAADVAERFSVLAHLSLAGSAQLVKTIGDAVMIVAAEGHAGVETALSLLRAVDAEPGFPGVRMGLQVGPVVERGGDVFGATVNVAARLAEHAHIGQLVTTAAVVDLAGPPGEVHVQALGPTRLKNIAVELDLFSMAVESHRPTTQVIDPVCRMLVDADDPPARLPWDHRIWSFCSFKCATAFASDPEHYSEV